MQKLAVATLDEDSDLSAFEAAPSTSTARHGGLRDTGSSRTGSSPARFLRLVDGGSRRSAILSSLKNLVQPKAPSTALDGAYAMQDAVRIVEGQGLGEANLVRMADKEMLFSEDGEAFIMYARRGRSLIALSDPVGPGECWNGLVERFIETALAAGCRPVFYQVSPALLGPCFEAGLKSLKLGEQAVVDLAGFDMKGGKWLSLRRSTNRAERDGLQFTFVPATEVAALLPELEAVSNAWLAHTRAREKSFSLGSFIPDYLASQPVAVMRLDGRLVAFASVLVTGQRQSAFIDLMRFVPGVHRGMMDLLFVKTMLHLKDAGFSALSLGMAPLAGLGDQDGAPLWNQLGKTVYECGESFYNFQGLRAFKSKFEPRWESRYLAVPAHSNAYLAIMDVAMLISGGFKGMFGK